MSDTVGPTILSNGKRDWTAYNATVVGSGYVPNAPLHPRHAPGLEATQGAGAKPSAYKNVFFGAQCEWPDDETGWQRVKRFKKRSKKVVRE